jgi:Phosphoadenosine phosphosulfate reductase family
MACVATMFRRLAIEITTTNPPHANMVVGAPNLQIRQSRIQRDTLAQPRFPLRRTPSVALILPWSTPRMRFCTSELKTEIICRKLTQLFPGQAILSVTGIRRQESSSRAKMPVVSPQAKLERNRCTGFNWNPIIDWSLAEVLDCIKSLGLAFTKPTSIFLSHVSRVNFVS